MICLESFYLVYLLHVLLANILFFFGIRFAEGNIKTIVIVKMIFDMAILMTLPLMMFMVGGICE